MPGEWHDYMESLFPEEMREVKFFCSTKNVNTNVCRKADIRLSNNRTCEIQHSYISESEIIGRFNDWNEFGKEIIWLIDGNEGIELDKLSNGNYLIKFKQYWKYKSFSKIYDNILLEIDKKVFKIELNKIKSNMIELKKPKTLQETIEFLKKKPDKIWDFWNNDNVIKSVLGIYQQGAGNGKTYGIWKSIIENVDKKTYIIVTKQHSAKTVIYEELNDQKKRYENGEDMFHIENLTQEINENTEKHYVIKYIHKKSKRECIVIIGTIDSFCFNLAHSNSKGSKFFEEIINNIKNNGATKINNGYMNYGGQNVQLSKECEIWIDEVQDLPENYLYAMCKLMYETSCYINVVGDKLQSLEFTNNFLTTIMNDGLPNITIDIKEPINKNRRIKVSNMGNKINKLINFTKYNLPIIECDEEISKEDNKEPIKIIQKDSIIYANDKDNEKIIKHCTKIMDNYKYEVETNNYLPNDFLIIFPIMKGNVIAPELETRIQEYWVNKNDDKYKQYVYLHKHTEGTVINTNDSKDATRIMSIRSSKGDGRKVVFILNVTEGTLKIVSNNEKELVYESYLHVALTRAKKQIYFELEKNNDDIYKRFGKTGYVEYLPYISNEIKLNKINETINKNSIIELLHNNNVNYDNINDKIQKLKNKKETVDWGYHCIKYQTYYLKVIIDILNNKHDNSPIDNCELFTKLNIISEKKIQEYDNVNEYYKYLYEYKNDNLPKFPLCKLSNKPEYEKYYDKIKETIEEVQKKIIDYNLKELNVYQSIILTFMIQIMARKIYSDISIMDIYNITNFFESGINKEKELLNNIKNVKNIINKSGIKKFKNINWNIFKKIKLDSKEEYFTINKYNIPIIGYNETDIIHIVLKTSLSKLNFWDIMIEVLLERFLIYNSKSDKDKERYNNKNINTYIYLLDECNYIKITWEWDKFLNKDIKDELKYSLFNYYNNNHYDIYKLLEYIKNNNKEEWEQSPDKIIDGIIKKCKDKKYPEYIIKFFDYINNKIEDGDDYDFINNFETFNEKINKKLELCLNKYFS